MAVAAIALTVAALAVLVVWGRGRRHEWSGDVEKFERTKRASSAPRSLP